MAGEMGALNGERNADAIGVFDAELVPTSGRVDAQLDRALSRLVRRRLERSRHSISVPVSVEVDSAEMNDDRELNVAMDARERERARSALFEGVGDTNDVDATFDAEAGGDVDDKSNEEKDVSMGEAETYCGRAVAEKELLSRPFCPSNLFPAIAISSKTNGVVPRTFSSFLVDLMSRVRCAASSRLQVGGGA